MTIADLRQDYTRDVLLEHELHEDPIIQFTQWFEAAKEDGVLEPNAFVLSTVSADGQPSGRTLLCKGITPEGLQFFTNYNSRKGQDLARNPKASMLFTWLPMQRQVHFEGVVEKMSEEESTRYFHMRPLASQIGAWASEQSRSMSREALEAREAEFKAKFGDNVPKPPHWGGYILKPARIEFWQGRTSRLHDRLVYIRTADGWELDRLSP